MIKAKASSIVNDSALPGATVKDALEAAGSAGLGPADRAKLDSIETGATQNSTDADLRDRATHTGTQSASTISDFAAATRAVTATQLVAGSNVEITAVGDTLVLSAAGGSGGLAPADRAKLDGIEAGATANSDDSYLLDRTNHTGTQPASTISGLTGAVEDILVPGSNISITQSGDNLVISSTAAGGSSGTLIYRKLVRATETTTIPDGRYDIIAVGTGGSGGAGYGAVRTTGGGGPAWARDWGFLAAPTSITITVGDRAMGVTGSTAGVNGAAGGTTTVTGNLAPITLTGGGGGRATNAGTDLDGGAGGVATGGLIRAGGGRGGNIRGSGARQATGGGAVDIFCLGADKTRGGDSLGTTSAVSTGGGGVAGRGGDATGTIQNTGGGGAGGDALDLAVTAGTCGPSINGAVGDGATPSDLEIADILLAYPGIAPVGGGYIANLSFGGGSSRLSPDTPVPFGGSSGRSIASGPVVGHAVSRGGGSGGASGAGTSAASAAGGEAFVIVSVYKD